MIISIAKANDELAYIPSLNTPECPMWQVLLSMCIRWRN